MIKLYFNFILLLGFFTVLVVGAVIYSGKRKSIVNRTWFIVSACASMWSFFYFLTINASSKESALIFIRFANAFGLLVALFWFCFVTVFLDIYRELKNRILILFLILVGVVVYFLSFNSWFMKDMVPKYVFNYYVDPGLGYLIYVIYFLFVVVLGLMLLLKYLKRFSGVRANQIKYIIIASAMGFLGGSSVFLLAFDIPFPPYLLVLYTTFPLAITYSIIKYRLMDIRAIIFRTIAFGFILLLITAVFSVVSTLISKLFTDLIGTTSNIIAGLVIALLVTLFYQPTRRFIERVTNAFLYKQSYDPDTLLSAINETTSSILNLDQLLNRVSKILFDAFHCEKIGVALLNGKNKLKVTYKDGFKPGVAEALVSFPNVVKIMFKQFKETPGIFVIDERKTQYDNGEFKPVSPKILFGNF